MFLTRVLILFFTLTNLLYTIQTYVLNLLIANPNSLLRESMELDLHGQRK